MIPGDLVKIEPTFFGYDNIPKKWHNSIFIVIGVKSSKKSYLPNQQFIYNVLTPEGTIYDFYDYELSDCYLAQDE